MSSIIYGDTLTLCNSGRKQTCCGVGNVGWRAPVFSLFCHWQCGLRKAHSTNGSSVFMHTVATTHLIGLSWPHSLCPSFLWNRVSYTQGWPRTSNPHASCPLPMPSAMLQMCPNLRFVSQSELLLVYAKFVCYLFFTCMCAHDHVACVHKCACRWSQRSTLQCCLYLLSTLHSEVGALTEPRAHWFSQVGQSASPRDLLGFVVPVLGLEAHVAVPSFSHECWQSEPRFSPFINWLLQVTFASFWPQLPILKLSFLTETLCGHMVPSKGSVPGCIPGCSLNCFGLSKCLTPLLSLKCLR